MRLARRHCAVRRHVVPCSEACVVCHCARHREVAAASRRGWCRSMTNGTMDGKWEADSMQLVGLGDDDLFGNEAAEDEDEDVFASYAYERAEVESFCSSQRPIQIVRAYKGEGKSALMRLARRRIGLSEDEIVIDTTGPDLSPAADIRDFETWVRAWKERILTTIASEIGARIGYAWDDDAISLVELAEGSGTKKRSFVAAIVDRLKLKDISRERAQVGDAGLLLKRWKSKSPSTWVFIDDVDRNFSGDARDHMRVAALVDACRGIARKLDHIRFRLAIRPNTWSSLKRAHEGLSHLEQYAIDLRWSEQDVLVLLGNRVEGYLKRRLKLESVSPPLSLEPVERSKQLVSLVFESPVRWGNSTRPMHVPLYTLSQHRPRWLIELCRVSAKGAHEKGESRIAMNAVIAQLPAFGKRRLQDTVVEFRPQCPEIEEILDAFRGQSEQYLTADLLKLIENRVLNHVTPRFPGLLGRPGHRDVAAFLFEIGFLFARRDFDDGSYQHLDFTSHPTLLSSRTDVDAGCSWEIPPAFRQALELRTVDGFVPPRSPAETKSARRIVRR